MTQPVMPASVVDGAQVQSSFTITMTDCVETVGVGLVATEEAQALVPPGFQLLNNGQPVTPLVALAIKSEGIAVADHKPKPGAYVQVGLLIASPDGVGDLNVYTLAHFTSDAKLAHSLNRLGLDARYTPTLAYDVSLDGDSGVISITVPEPGRPTLSLKGTITAPSAPMAVSANWWARVDGGRLKMSTQAPDELIGEAQLTLTVDPDSLLGRLIGGDTLGFAVLQRFNRFPHARTEATVMA